MKSSTILRLFSLLLVILTLTAAAAGCGKPGTDTVVTTSADAPSATTGTPGEETEPEPEFVSANYNDETFTLYARSTTVSSYNTVYMMAAETSGDMMEDAVYRRNVAVEDKYHIRLEMLEATNPYKDLQNRDMGGDDSIDLMFDQRRYMGGMITGGYLSDMMEYADIMRFEAPYWDANAYTEYQIANRLYMMPNDVSTQNLAGVRFLYFNKEMLESRKLKSPYDYVNDNDWVIDNFTELAAACLDDLNGDGLYNYNDIVGIVYDNTMIRNMISGCGVKFTTNNADGTISASFANERTEAAISKLREGLYGKQYAVTYDTFVKGADQSGFATKYIYSASLFAQNRFMFIYWGLNCTDLLREMQTGYGIAPNPRLDADQDRYYHREDGYVPIFTIPNCVRNKERTAVILEYWAYQSSKTVMPTYYDVTIKSRRVPDATAGIMLDIIKGSIRYEISEECQTFGIDEVLNEVYDSGNFSSSVRANEKSINSKMSAFYDAVMNLN